MSEVIFWVAIAVVVSFILGVVIGKIIKFGGSDDA